MATSNLPTEDSRWTINFTPDRSPRVNLLCLPYAGGGAGIYRRWADRLPSWIGVLAAQLPGRETRFRDPLVSDVAPLVDRLADTVMPLAAVSPLALFGHSMGAILAWELAHALRERGGVEPCHLLLSGRRAPDQRPLFPPLHGLPDAEFRRELKRLGGTPPEVLANDELMGLMLPVLRADFTLSETWQAKVLPPLACRLTTFAGSDDAEAPPSAMSGWAQATFGTVSHHVLSGGHFFLNESRAALLERIVSALDRHKPGGGFPTQRRR